jgi:glycerol-3-phosphate dehydrogenase (NAD(P)+)
MQLAVIGAGKWGQALYGAFRDAGVEVALSGRTPKAIEGFVPLAQAMEAPALVVALPAQVSGAWLHEHFIDRGQRVLVASKGIEVETGRFLNAVYEPFVSADRLAFLSGPSFAAEVQRHLPTALTIAASHEETATHFMALFPEWIKTYRSEDVIGAEVAGAYKNVIAIAAGVSDALGLGNNARAALVTRGLAEMARFGLFFGAKVESFMGLAGVGDLFLTASSTLSRNYRVGAGLGGGKTLQAILEELGEVAEGVPTTRAVVALAEKKQLYVPIAREVAALIEGKDPRQSLHDLLSGANKEEF